MRQTHPARAAPVAIAALLIIGLLPSTALAAPPSNDNFASRTTIPLAPYDDMQNTSEATLETGEQQPVSCGEESIGRTVWYAYTPATPGLLQIDTAESDFDTMLAVWTGTALGSLAEVVCNDDTAGLTSRVVFEAAAGTTYLIQAGGWVDDGGQLRLSVAPAPPLGSISGTVTADGGGPLKGICVDVYSGPNWAGSAVTNASGRYEVHSLEPASYLILFTDVCGGRIEYVREWYSDAPTRDDADPVRVTGPNEHTGIDASLGLGGFVTGKVTDAATRQPLRGVCVEAFDPDGEAFSFVVTDASGGYRAGGLPSGSYVVWFSHCEAGEPRYQEEYYDNKPSVESADRLAVTAPGGHTRINAALVPKSGQGSKQVMLTAKPRRPKRGKQVLLTARVLPCGGDPGDIVDFARGSKLIDTERTNRSCEATTTVRVKKRAVFTASSPADAEIGGGTSSPVTVRPRPRR